MRPRGPGGGITATLCVPRRASSGNAEGRGRDERHDHRTRSGGTGSLDLALSSARGATAAEAQHDPHLAPTKRTWANVGGVEGDVWSRASPDRTGDPGSGETPFALPGAGPAQEIGRDRRRDYADRGWSLSARAGPPCPCVGDHALELAQER